MYQEEVRYKQGLPSVITIFSTDGSAVVHTDSLNDFGCLRSRLKRGFRGIRLRSDVQEGSFTGINVKSLSKRRLC